MPRFSPDLGRIQVVEVKKSGNHLFHHRASKGYGSIPEGALGFSVLDIFLIGFSVFVSKDVGFSVLVFNAVCGFFVF